jgi:FkbH-like protein
MGKAMRRERVAFVQNIVASLARDRNLSLSRKLDKGLRYISAVALAPFHLRACDRIGARARTRGRPEIESLGSIEIGDDFQLNSAFVPVELRVGPEGALRIGDGVNVNFGVKVSVEQSVTIGSRVNIAPYVTISDHDDGSSPLGPSAPVVIEDDVWLATRVRVMRGSKIGHGTVVMAGSVVSGELPPGVVAGGVPARVLRKRVPLETAPPDPTSGVRESGAFEKVVGVDNGALPHGAVENGVTRAAPDHSGILIADFTVHELADHLGRDDRLGPTVAASVAPFGQVVQSLHDLDALAKETRADFAVVWTRPESALPSFGQRLRGEAVTIDRILADVDAFAELLLRAAPAVKQVFVPTWTTPAWLRGLGMTDTRAEGVAGALMRANARLSDALEKSSSVFVLDAMRWLQTTGISPSNAKLWYMGKLAFPKGVFAEAAKDIRAGLRGMRGQARKLVVLDLDDTLWGGIVGDVGWENLRLGGHDAIGEAFVDFQCELKALSRRGISLAIVSKNEESVALEAIRSHPEMVLKMEDVSAYRINWRDKAMNVAEIVKELNLGMQSVVFIDDNPVERARVREALPEVFVPEWPEDKTQYVPALHALRCFDVPRISEEDRDRTKMYATERLREELKTRFESLDDWLMGLGTRVRFSRLDPAILARTVQLLNKTNQMNLRTRRLTEAELLAWDRERGHEVWAVHVSDSLGDAGLTGVLGLELVGHTATVVDYVLSCRVMGRKVEETLVWFAAQRARAAGASRVTAPFFPTSKNKPCLSFWQTTGFAWRADTNTFEWDLAAEFPLPRSVQVDGAKASPAAEAAVG